MIKFLFVGSKIMSINPQRAMDVSAIDEMLSSLGDLLRVSLFVPRFPRSVASQMVPALLYEISFQPRPIPPRHSDDLTSFLTVGTEGVSREFSDYSTEHLSTSLTSLLPPFLVLVKHCGRTTSFLIQTRILLRVKGDTGNIYTRTQYTRTVYAQYTRAGPGQAETCGHPGK